MSITIFGTIGWSVTEKDVVADLKEEDGDEVEVFINSHGGDLFEGMGIAMALRRHDAKVIAHVDGLAASAASLIAMGADEVHMPEPTQMMIHNPAAFVFGDHQKLGKVADSLEDMRDSMMTLYTAKTGLDDDEVKSMLDDETWMSAEEAVDKNFADVLVELDDGDDEEDEVVARIADQIAARHDSDFPDFDFDHMPVKVAAMVRRGAQIAAASLRPAASLKRRGADMGSEDKKSEESTSASHEAHVDVEPKVVARESRMSGGDTGVDDIIKSERERVDAIKARCENANLSAEKTLEIITKADSEEAAKDMIITALSHKDQAPDFSGGPSISAGADSREKFREGAVDGILMRGGAKDHDAQNPFRGMPLLRIAEDCIIAAGGKRPATSREIIQQAMNVVNIGGHSRSDFPDIMRDAIHKQAMRGYQEAESNWDQWCVTGSLSDFREAPMVSTTLFDNLKPVGELGEYEYGSVGDRGEKIQLGKYGRRLRISEEAIIDDNLGLLTRAPQKMGAAAARVAQKLAIAVLTDNPTMEDGEPLFSSAHGNTYADELGFDGVDKLTQEFELQTIETEDGDEEPIDVTPSILLVPTQLRRTANDVNTAEYRSADLGQKNDLQGMYVVIRDKRLGHDSAVKWYLLADPNLFDTIMVAFRDGNAMPIIEQKDGWKGDWIEYKVRQEAAAAPMGPHGIFRGGDGT